MAFKVEVDEASCIGCGACVKTCPENFKLVDGKSKPITPKVDDTACVQEAADACPVQCIMVKEE